MAEWLDILPAIPLVRGVPVRERLPDGRWVGFANATDDQTVLTILGLRRCSDLGPLRVDLDDPQGVAYAAAYWLRLMVERDEGVDAIKQYQFWMQRCALGETTDADRVALAKALRDHMYYRYNTSDREMRQALVRRRWLRDCHAPAEDQND